MRCEWFALCTNEAETEHPHPILGAVPICARCLARVSHLSDCPVNNGPALTPGPCDCRDRR